MKLTMLLFLTMGSIGVAQAQSMPTKSVLSDSYIIPADKGAGESSSKLVLQFSNPFAVSTSKINDNKYLYTDWERSGKLYFQNGQWVAGSKVVLENSTFCELHVFSGEMYGGFDSFEKYLENESKGIYSDIVVKENMTVRDVYYSGDSYSSSGKYIKNNSASILIGRWNTENINGKPVTHHLGSNPGDKVASVRVYKNFTGISNSSPTPLEITVADLKSCFGSDLSVIEVPAEQLVP